MRIVEITKENYKTEVEESKGKVFIDFYANWCGPCRMMSPIIDELSDEITDIKFVKINVDDNEEVSRKYGIMSIPTFVLLEAGNILAKKVGSMSKEDVKKMLDK